MSPRGFGNGGPKQGISLRTGCAFLVLLLLAILVAALFAANLG